MKVMNRREEEEKGEERRKKKKKCAHPQPPRRGPRRTMGVDRVTPRKVDGIQPCAPSTKKKKRKEEKGRCPSQNGLDRESPDLNNLVNNLDLAQPGGPPGR